MAYLLRVRYMTLFMCMDMIISYRACWRFPFRSIVTYIKLYVVWNKRDFMFHSNALKSIIKVIVVISFTHPIWTLNVGITSFLSHLCSKLSKRSHHTAQTIRSTCNNRLSHSPNNKNKLNYLSLTCTAHAHSYILTKASYIYLDRSMYRYARYKTPFLHAVNSLRIQSNIHDTKRSPLAHSEAYRHIQMLWKWHHTSL